MRIDISPDNADPTMFYGTSNTRTPNSCGFCASHGEACKTVCAADVPSRQSLSIEEPLN